MRQCESMCVAAITAPEHHPYTVKIWAMIIECSVT